jgi:predicted secreted hydrolase
MIPRIMAALVLGVLVHSAAGSPQEATAVDAIAARASTANSDTPWKRVIGEPSLHWPRDHGSHPEYETEWWYTTGDLTDGAGRRFGYQVTIFRRGLEAGPPAPEESRLRPREIFAANVAVVDVSSGVMSKSERVRRGCAGLAGADETDLHAWVEDWRIDRTQEGTLRLHAADIAQGLALDLELEPEKPLVLHGTGGVSQKSAAPGNASIYSSWTRLRTRGTIQIGRWNMPALPSFSVMGESWYDHEFGSSQLGSDVAGWDWFGLRLNDGRELMLYRMRTSNGDSSPSSAGTLVERDGSTRALGPADFRVVPAAIWKSTLTRAAYPIAWKIAVPSAGIDGRVEARLGNCEFDARASVGLIYWEGPVSLSGSVEGSGYLELTGYSAPLGGRF